MYRIGVMLLAASIIIGCSEPTADYAVNEKPVSDSALAEMKSKPAAETKEAVETPADEFASLQSAMQKSEAAFMQKVRNAPREEQMELFMSGGDKHEFAIKFLDLSKQHAGEEFEFDALKIAAEKGEVAVSSEAFDTIVDKFADDDRVLDLLKNFGRTIGMPTQKHEDFLQSLVSKSTNDVVKGGASFSLVKLYQSLGDMKDSIPPEMIDAIPKETLDYISMDRGEEFDGEIQAMLEEISKNYADVEFGSKTLGDLADDELFVFNHLSLGKEAPDIEGVDLDGEEFNLSDYRGKVVMLDFWGDW